MTAPLPTNPNRATEAAVEAARVAVAHFPDCFWVRQPEAPIYSVADVELIVRRLRQHGGRRAWDAALEIERCL